MEQKNLGNEETLAQLREGVIQIKNVEDNCRIRCKLIQQKTEEKIKNYRTR